MGEDRAFLIQFLCAFGFIDAATRVCVSVCPPGPSDLSLWRPEALAALLALMRCLHGRDDPARALALFRSHVTVTSATHPDALYPVLPTLVPVLAAVLGQPHIPASEGALLSLDRIVLLHCIVESPCRFVLYWPGCIA